MAENTVIDITTFITTLTDKNHDIILSIDANKNNVSLKNMTSKLCHTCNLVDSLELNHDTSQGPNIYIVED